MRHRSVFSSLLYFSPWLIACTIVNFQRVLVIEAFHQTSFGTKKTISASSNFHFSPFVSSTRLFDTQQDNSDDTNIQAAKTEEQVEVGTKDYYSGFLSSPIQDETVAERGSGLEQALKLGGGVVLVLIVLFAGFMASNGLI